MLNIHNSELNIDRKSYLFSPQWINSRTLVLVDSHEKLQVVDRPSQEVLETLDLEQVQLVYNSRHFKSLATGGNVSQALVRKWQMDGEALPHI